MVQWQPLITRILHDQITSWQGIHGLTHWGRVYDMVCDYQKSRVRIAKLSSYSHFCMIRRGTMTELISDTAIAALSTPKHSAASFSN